MYFVCFHVSACALQCATVRVVSTSTLTSQVCEIDQSLTALLFLIHYTILYSTVNLWKHV
jgi:hypothetical protein